MNKLEEAKNILKELKVPSRQQSDLCGYVILAMSNIKEKVIWSKAANDWIRIHDVIKYIKDNYGVVYAENSRETFRKQAMHHFRNAAFIEDNAKPTNSPNYCYRLTDEMLSLIQKYGTNYWKKAKEKFLLTHESLIDLYSSKRTIKKCLLKSMEKILHFLQGNIMNYKN